ncbi:MAG: DNA repair exonuclease, partial [Planctomycetota bacterium]
MVKFIHTSDWQLGAAFAQIPGDSGAYLRTQRLETVDRIGLAAQEEQAQFVLVAGDLFDAHTVGNDVVTQMCEKVGRFSVPVYVIPGNHDFASAPESVYQRERFIQRKPDNLYILQEPCPIQIPGTPAIVLPCPLRQRHTVVDPTGWMGSDTGRGLGGDAIRIGLAHGSVVDFAPEDGGTTANLIDPAVIDRAALDYLALGDWHGCRQVTDKAWYSGTPEPDRFREGRPGGVLIVTIRSAGDLPDVREVEVGACRWRRHAVTVHGAEDVAALEKWFNALETPERTLVRLEIDGVLGIESAANLEQLLRTQAELLLHLRQRGGGAGGDLRRLEQLLQQLSVEGPLLARLQRQRVLHGAV